MEKITWDLKGGEIISYKVWSWAPSKVIPTNCRGLAWGPCGHTSALLPSLNTDRCAWTVLCWRVLFHCVPDEMTGNMISTFSFWVLDYSCRFQFALIIPPVHIPSSLPAIILVDQMEGLVAFHQFPKLSLMFIKKKKQLILYHSNQTLTDRQFIIFLWKRFL